LCKELLEPLQATFGRVHIRSAYRSPEVNDYGNKNGLNCATNERNFAGHIWDYPDRNGKRGATACIVLPWLVDHIDQGGKWTDMAWWIHDHLPYHSLFFFPRLAAFNISWHEAPRRTINSYVEPRGYLTRPGMPNHLADHSAEYAGFPPLRAAAQGTKPTPESTRDAVSSPASGESVKAAVHEMPVVGSMPTLPDGRIRYRAVHTKTRWRKVNAAHASIENALFGKDGAAGLFARRVRIDYEKHGDPQYVLVWQDGAERGYVVRADAQAAGGIRIVEVAAASLLAFEDAGYCETEALAKLF
jgi:hypothetical protein